MLFALACRLKDRTGTMLIPHSHARSHARSAHRTLARTLSSEGPARGRCRPKRGGVWRARHSSRSLTMLPCRCSLHALALCYSLLALAHSHAAVMQARPRSLSLSLALSRTRSCSRSYRTRSCTHSRPRTLHCTLHRTPASVLHATCPLTRVLHAYICHDDRM
jgi:hypothetical protein